MEMLIAAARLRAWRACRLACALTACAFMLVPLPAQAMRIAFGDIPGIDSLNLLIAVERARERGLDIDLHYFESEDIAAQAVAGGEADLGIGSPYDLIEQSSAPIRLVYQLSQVRFFPVVNGERYDEWADLDGEEITVHSRDSATEAIAQWMASRHGIEYRRINYVPGSEVRAGAMLAGSIHATIVDASGWRMLRQQNGERFRRLPTGDTHATDEGLYALASHVEGSRHKVRILLEEMLRTWRQINANPAVIAQLRDRYNLLPYLSQTSDARISAYYRESVANRVFPNDGGSPAAVRDDLELYASDPAHTMQSTDFWHFELLQEARRSLAEE